MPNPEEIKAILNGETNTEMNEFHDHISDGEVTDDDFLDVIAKERPLLKRLKKVNARIKRRGR